MKKISCVVIPTSSRKSFFGNNIKIGNAEIVCFFKCLGAMVNLKNAIEEELK
jgi:hypothetical protein